MKSVNTGDLEKFIIINKIVYWVILALNILVPLLFFVLSSGRQIQLRDIQDSFSYHDAVNETSGSLSFYADHDCQGNVTLAFFNGNQFLSQQTFNVNIEYGSDLFNPAFVSGHVTHYEIVSSNLISKANPMFFLAYYGLIITLPTAISSSFLHLKKYQVNGVSIVCYAGWYHHYLLVNNKLVDEHNAFSNRVPVQLYYEDDFHHYDMMVSTSNAIRLKVDGRLVSPLDK